MKTLEQLKEINLNDLNSEQLEQLKNDILLMKEEDTIQYIEYVTDCVWFGDNDDIVFNNYTKFIKFPEIIEHSRETVDRFIDDFQKLTDRCESLKKRLENA